MIHKLQALYRIQATGFAFLGIRLLGTPLWSLLSFLIFVLYKYTDASPLQIAIVLALKPTSSLLSPYWSQTIYKRPDQILRNLIGANCLRHTLFLCIPWVQASWFIILSFGLYMVWTRAMFPAWIELFARKIPKTEQEKWISAATVIDYAGAAVFTVGCGFVLDRFPTSWPWIFFSTACLGLASTSYCYL